jgi:hypothetical protein
MLADDKATKALECIYPGSCLLGWQSKMAWEIGVKVGFPVTQHVRDYA